MSPTLSTETTTSTPDVGPRVLRVGIIGCGEVSQVVHIPTLSFLSDLFEITYLCDISRGALAHCSRKVLRREPQTTRDPEELCSSVLVDVVFVLNSDEYHTAHGILALKHNKHVFIEKPMALNDRDADALIKAEQESQGKVIIGYMRRYAAVFADAVKEIGGMDKILYARVRDIIGPNSTFVGQSGTFPKRFTDIDEADANDQASRAVEMVIQGLEKEAGVTGSKVLPQMWRVLGSLGSHDLSLMREALGMPVRVIGASLQMPFWSAIFEYPTFTVTYESGFDSIPRFDAHLEVYSESKSVRVEYDTPYVKGLPVTLHISENKDGILQETKIHKTYEDPYTLEMKELYEIVVNGKPVKTSAVDAKKDLELFRMLVRAAYAANARIQNDGVVTGE